MNNEMISINEVPSITWNWLKTNKDVITVNNTFAETKAKFAGIKEDSGDKTIAEKFAKVSSGVFNKSTPKAYDNRKVDGSYLTAEEIEAVTKTKNEAHEIEKLVKASVKEPQFIRISGKYSEPVILNFDFEKSQVSAQNIYAEENAEATLIFLFKGNPEAAILQTKVFAEAYAKLHIVKVQLLGSDALMLDDTGIAEEDNAEVTFTQIELGGKHIDSGLHVNLYGYKSAFKSDVAYLCQNQQFLDMNHIVYHYGKKTTCNMFVNGTVKDNAVKTYRGTIDLKKGCCGAKGNEMEETLILSPKTINKSLPVILCDEEDVEGEHGATIGRLSSDILFYMQSRGISEEEAEKLMSQAKVAAAASKIPHEPTVEMIQEYIQK